MRNCACHPLTSVPTQTALGAAHVQSAPTSRFQSRVHSWSCSSPWMSMTHSRGAAYTQRAAGRALLSPHARTGPCRQAMLKQDANAGIRGSEWQPLSNSALSGSREIVVAGHFMDGNHLIQWEQAYVKEALRGSFIGISCQHLPPNRLDCHTHRSCDLKAGEGRVGSFSKAVM